MSRQSVTRCSLTSRDYTPERACAHTHTHTPQRTARIRLPLWGPCLTSNHSFLLWASFWILCCEAQCCSLLVSWQNNKLSHRTILGGWTANSQWKHSLFILVALVFQFMVSKWRHCGYENTFSFAVLTSLDSFPCSSNSNFGIQH